MDYLLLLKEVSCGNGDVTIDAAIPSLVHTVVIFIKVFVPIVLIILGMVDIFKAVIAQKDDDMKKAQGILIKRIIYAVLVFFIVAIVQFVFSAVDSNDEVGTKSCINCFINNNCNK